MGVGGQKLPKSYGCRVWEPPMLTAQATEREETRQGGGGYGRRWRACCEGWLVGCCGCDGFNFVICFDEEKREQRGATNGGAIAYLTCRTDLPEGEFARAGSIPTSKTAGN